MDPFSQARFAIYLLLCFVNVHFEQGYHSAIVSRLYRAREAMLHCLRNPHNVHTFRRICRRNGLHTQGALPVKSIAALLEKPGNVESSQIQVNGFVNSLRRQKKVVFATLRDGSTTTPLQAILDPVNAAG